MALAGTLPVIYLARHRLFIAMLASSLFVRGMGLSAIGVPSTSAAYSSVRREDLPIATTALNIVMRIGGPTLTTVCATFLWWRLAPVHSLDTMQSAFTETFLLLCLFHALLFIAASRLPCPWRKPLNQFLLPRLAPFSRT